MSDLLTGSFVALLTPFNQDGSLDIEGFGTLINFQAENGTSALLIMGSTGEVSLLSKEERQKVIRETLKFKTRKIQLWYGCTGPTTRDTIEMVQFAGREGADGAIVTVPSYVVIPVKAAIGYFKDVADTSPIPIGIYNNPTRVGTDLGPEAIIELAEHPRVTIVKEAMARPGQIAQVLASVKDLSVMCCDSPNLGLVPSVMSLGGHGTANMSGNLAPREMAIISKPWESYEDVLNFQQAYLRLLPLIRFNYSRINPVPVKSLAGALGLPAGDLRKPYMGLTSEEVKQGISIVRGLGLDEQYGYQISSAMLAGTDSGGAGNLMEGESFAGPRGSCSTG